MLKKIEPPLRMTSNEASSRYPNELILMEMDSMDLSDDVGVVLYVGDNRADLYSMMDKIDAHYLSVVEGLNLQRNCLGGIVANG